MVPYEIIKPTGSPIPILVSVPHCSTHFPEELEFHFNRELILDPDDTDYYVDKLYDFVPKFGITLIKAVNSRFIVDLNRNPEDEPLYTDGRLITSVCPTTNFLEEPIYKYDPPDSLEIKRRVDQYFTPYHDQIQIIINGFLRNFGIALLFDAHSIRQEVKSIHKEPFPDLILGDNKGKTADREFSKAAMRVLSTSDYSVAHNYLFKGGYITRSFGNPEKGVHALQLEMTKINYMDWREKEYDVEKADKMRSLLKTLLISLSEKLK